MDKRTPTMMEKQLIVWKMTFHRPRKWMLGVSDVLPRGLIYGFES
jgi:hypothetical protein